MVCNVKPETDPPRPSKPRRACWSSSELAGLIGVHQNTVIRWHAQRSLVGSLYPSGRRYYTVEHLYQAVGRPRPDPFPAEYQSFIMASVRTVMDELAVDARTALDEVERRWHRLQKSSFSPT
jgi:hypothetical protein